MPHTIPFLCAPALSDRRDVCHGFSTQHDGQGGRLDLGQTTSPGRWAQVAASIGVPGGAVARLRQVHGNAVKSVTVGGDAGTGDALITQAPGLILAVRTADCVPVLFVLGRPAFAVAAVHSGWRGTAADIVGVTLGALRDIDPLAPIHAVIGPAISGPCYEVGEEVVAGIAATGVPEAVFVSRSASGPRPHADVGAAVRWQIERHGEFVVETIDRCTYRDPSLWSHRRDGLNRGSLAALVALAPA